MGEVKMETLSPENALATRQRSRGRPMWNALQSEFIRRTAYRIIEHRTYPDSFSILEKLRAYEFAPREALEAYQWGRLRNVLLQAQQNVPYYEKLFRSLDFDPATARLPEDMALLPALTKSILRDEGKNLLACNVDPRLLMPNASGGSTGKPVEFYQTKEYWEAAHASRSLFLGWWNVSHGEPMASIWGADRDIPDWTLRERLYYKLCQVRICNAFALDSTRMEQFALMLDRWQPRFINGYASALEVFARFLLEHGGFKIRPVAVESSAEVLTDAQRAIVSKAFEAPVYNFYGSREVNNLAAECQMHSGLHVNEFSRFIEIVDDDGKPLKPGVPGRLLVTDLTNPAMPLIRYENEDIGSWANFACPCGRPFRLLEKIWGRSSDFITTKSGKLIHGEYFTHLFYHSPQVSTFQVVQTSLNELSLSIVLQPGTGNFSLKPLEERLLHDLGEGMSCEIKVVSSIPRTPSGKHRFTLSMVPPRWSDTDHQEQGTLS